MTLPKKPFNLITVKSEMAFKYFPHTGQDIDEMLARIGVKTLDDLYADVPSQVRLHGDYDLPKAMSEVEVRRYFDDLCRNDRQLTCFAGAGSLRPLHSFADTLHRGAFRVPDELHPVSGRDISRHAAIHLRVPDHDGASYRHGHIQRFNV